MTDTNLLQEVIKKSGLKLQFLADSLGISRTALGNKIQNETEFKASEILALCVLLKIEDPELKEKIFFAH